MSEQNVETSKADEAEEVLDVIFPSGDEAAEVVHPRKEPLDFPASAIAAQLASILAPAPVAPVGRDHLNAVFLLERAVERVRIVGPCRRRAGRGAGRGSCLPEHTPQAGTRPAKRCRLTRKANRKSGAGSPC